MATAIKMPQLGLTMEEGMVSRWLKHEGDIIHRGDSLLEVTTDKLTNDIAADADGVLLKIVVDAGFDVPVQTVLGWIGEEGEAVPEETGQISANASEEHIACAGQTEQRHEDSVRMAAQAATNRVKISPLAKKMAKEMGISYEGLKGSGPGGRIRKIDILLAKEAGMTEGPDAERPDTTRRRPDNTTVSLRSPFLEKQLDAMEGDTRETLSSMRQTVARRMYEASSEIPSVTLVIKADVTELVKFRKEINESRGVKLSVNDFLLKATAKALRESPSVRVSLDGNQIIHREQVNLGMAVALEEGLIVPVIRDADKISLTALSRQANELAGRAREGKLTAEEYQGSTLTVTNLGMYGVDSFNPIINQPDAVILGIGGIDDEIALHKDGTIYAKKVLKLCVTFAHRWRDGSAAAKFGAKVRDLLAYPLDILL